MEQELILAKAFHDCKTKGIKNINKCFHPNCNDKSINSHILQKNGILSTIAKDGHVVEMQINKYNENVHSFKKIGIKNAFSFNCFCLKHDTELFKTIELQEIDFTIYKNLLLFTLRTIYNEKFKKLVNIEMYKCLIATHPDLFDIYYLTGCLRQERLGLKDLEKSEQVIWKDLNTDSESYIFKTREITKKEICLSAFYNYETSLELLQYRQKNGKEKDDVSDIFVNIFPYKDKSVLMMAYKKENEFVKSYFNEFFTESEKRLERKITNLMMFQCETWAISDKFYKTKILKVEKAFSFATEFSVENMNERKFFDLNIFQEDFPQKFEKFKKEAPNYLRKYGN